MGADITEILDVLDSGNILWIGRRPPRFDMAVSEAAVDPSQDFRLHHTHHQAFDAVFLVEQDLATFKQWPLILDEALRAVAPQGIFVVRIRQSALLSIFQLANFLEKWTGGQYALINQSADGDHFLIAMRLLHVERRSARTDSFSFALITDGRKPSSVKAFVTSALEVDRGSETEIEVLVCGPQAARVDLGALADSVRWINQTEAFSSKGWITQKKNSLVANALGETIIVAHDRYRVPRDFIFEIQKFGGDFDVLSPRQTTLDGEPLPDWVMMSDLLNWTTPGWMEHGDYHPLGYVNGGAIIAKTQRLKQTRWNELLFWGQAEDVDLSRRLSDVGVVPRLARRVELRSETPRPGFYEVFERLPLVTDSYPMTHRSNRGRTTPLGPAAMQTAANPPYVLGTVIALDEPDSIDQAAKLGLILQSGWTSIDKGMIWTDGEAASFSIKLVGQHHRPTLSLRLALPEHTALVSGLSVNGKALDFASDRQGLIEAELPEAVLDHGPMLHFRLEHSGECPILKRFRIINGGPSSVYDLDKRVTLNAARPISDWFGVEWHAPDTECIWTTGLSAQVIVPIEVGASGSFECELDLVGDFSEDLLAQRIVIRTNNRVAGRCTLTVKHPRRRVTFSLPEVTDGEAIFGIQTNRTKRVSRDTPMSAPRTIGVGLASLRLYGAER